ncbi:MAG: GNAT family N-acetyltransferase [Burkholderiales bacterium]|nr:GNAT family N-acetyltransferase [Burkholderiales bacterium]
MAQLFPIIDTPRLRLREITETDIPALLAMYDLPETMQWLGADPLVTADHAAALVAFIRQGWSLPVPEPRWGIERRDHPGLLIGTVGLRLWDTGARHCQLGYQLDWRHRSRGYAHEALSTLLAWCFDRMELHRVNALVHPDNAPSLRVLQKLGFEVEGLMRDGGFWAGRHHDLLSHGLLRRAFAGARFRAAAASPAVQPVRTACCAIIEAA